VRKCDAGGEHDDAGRSDVGDAGRGILGDACRGDDIGDAVGAM
jgi:hypothetical protein